jgi:hypothetical protein
VLKGLYLFLHPYSNLAAVGYEEQQVGAGRRWLG